MNAVTRSPASGQPVKIEAGNVHVLRSRCVRQRIKSAQRPVGEIRTDTATAPGLKQLPETAVTKVSYHERLMSTHS